MEYEQIYQLILNDELGWEHLITTIVREENMNPLDIDLTRIVDRFVEYTVKMENIDFRFSGKFVYTAAILLKMKSDALMDKILERDLKRSEGRGSTYIRAVPAEIAVFPRISVSRTKPRTIMELLGVIRELMSMQRKLKVNFKLQPKEIKIEERMLSLMKKLASLFKKEETIAFSSLLQERSRKEVVYTFLPLVLLASQRKVDLFQNEPFSEIYVKEAGA
ncbi:MAG: segregation/condensation protein A [Candidatus Parvarchaeota archaeon]|nr:segregation/condensation protein A [Candidatus Parvarchaeota archaeon]MCW1301884.1 segregation/condensation protein A [Candidatus Parvarchaeota archaeon]